MPRLVKTIYVGGVPASGKSSLLRLVREMLFPGAAEFRHGLCRGVSLGRFHMLGVFDGSTFEGTDRLSMAVIGDALGFVSALEAAGERAVVFAEGDRLFNRRFLESTGAEAFALEATLNALGARRALRARKGCCQTERFLSGRRTHVERMVKEMGIRRLRNDTPLDRRRIAEMLVGRARRWVGTESVSI